MTRWSMALAIAWLVAGCTGGAERISLDELIARHTSARGGAEAIESLQGIEIELRIVEPAFQVEGRYVATRDGRMRIDVAQDGQHVFTEALVASEAGPGSPA